MIQIMRNKERKSRVKMGGRRALGYSSPHLPSSPSLFSFFTFEEVIKGKPQARRTMNKLEWPQNGNCT